MSDALSNIIDLLKRERVKIDEVIADLEEKMAKAKSNKKANKNVERPGNPSSSRIEGDKKQERF